MPDRLRRIIFALFQMDKSLDLGARDFRQHPVSKRRKKVFLRETFVQILRVPGFVRKEVWNIVLVPEFLEGEGRVVIFTAGLELSQPLICYPAGFRFGAAGW